MFDVRALPLERQPLWLESEEQYTDPSDGTLRAKPTVILLDEGYEIQSTGGTVATTPTGDRVAATHIFIGPVDPAITSGSVVQDGLGVRYKLGVVQDWTTHLWAAGQKIGTI